MTNHTTPTTAPGIDLDKERELAELAAEHYGYSKDDVKHVDKMLANKSTATSAAQADDAKPVAEVDEGDDGLFIAFIYGPDGSPLKRGDKLYATPIGQQDEMAANMTELTIENVEFLVWLLSERIKTWEDYIWIVDEAKKTKRPILGTDEDDCRERVSKARAALANIVSIGKTCAPTAAVAGQTEKGEPK